jgi:hypothetical protein
LALQDCGWVEPRPLLDLHYTPLAYILRSVMRHWRIKIRILMVFIETPIFTKSLAGLVTDEEYRMLQNDLLNDPEAGSLIRGGGGIRKIRAAAGGKGKSGGVRVIYLYKKVNNQIYMLLAYPKSAKETLTEAETRILRELAKQI